jgi:hypothetical protein
MKGYLMEECQQLLLASQFIIILPSKLNLMALRGICRQHNPLQYCMLKEMNQYYFCIWHVMYFSLLLSTLSLLLQQWPSEVAATWRISPINCLK